MIQARARIQHQLNQQGLTAIYEAFEHANSLDPRPQCPLFYQHRCQNFCFPLGFVLTLEAKRCTQLQLSAQNLASSGAGMVASGSGLTCHVIP
jgi:hypothetical protein